MAKNLLTLVTLVATGYARILGQRRMQAAEEPVADGTTRWPTRPRRSRRRRVSSILQYAIPAHVGGLIAMSALMSEQQRPAQVDHGVERRLVRHSPREHGERPGAPRRRAARRSVLAGQGPLRVDWGAQVRMREGRAN